MNTLNCVPDADADPPRIVPPADVFNSVPAPFNVPLFSTVATTSVPSGTVLPAESLIPVNVIVSPVALAVRDIEVGPDAVVLEVPRRKMLPTANARCVSTIPLPLAGAAAIVTTF